MGGRGCTADAFVTAKGADFRISGGLYFERGTRPKLQPCEKIYPTV